MQNDSNRYENVINYIVQEKEKGVGSRKIAKELNISKSSVNYYYERYKQENKVTNTKTTNSVKIFIAA